MKVFLNEKLHPYSVGFGSANYFPNILCKISAGILSQPRHPTAAIFKSLERIAE